MATNPTGQGSRITRQALQAELDKYRDTPWSDMVEESTPDADEGEAPDKSDATSTQDWGRLHVFQHKCVADTYRTKLPQGLGAPELLTGRSIGLSASMYSFYLQALIVRAARKKNTTCDTDMAKKLKCFVQAIR